jgi:hypothetical protein
VDRCVWKSAPYADVGIRRPIRRSCCPVALRRSRQPRTPRPCSRCARCWTSSRSCLFQHPVSTSRGRGGRVSHGGRWLARGLVDRAACTANDAGTQDIEEQPLASCEPWRLPRIWCRCVSDSLGWTSCGTRSSTNIGQNFFRPMDPREGDSSPDRRPQRGGSQRGSARARGAEQGHR